jgi:hypothetical protein
MINNLKNICGYGPRDYLGNDYNRIIFKKAFFNPDESIEFFGRCKYQSHWTISKIKLVCARILLVIMIISPFFKSRLTKTFSIIDARIKADNDETEAGEKREEGFRKAQYQKYRAQDADKSAETSRTRALDASRQAWDAVAKIEALCRPKVCSSTETKELAALKHDKVAQISGVPSLHNEHVLNDKYEVQIIEASTFPDTEQLKGEVRQIFSDGGISSEEFEKEFAGDNNQKTFVAVHHGKIVGAGSVRIEINKKRVCLHHLAISPNYRGSNEQIGTRIVLDIFKFTAEKVGLRNVYLEYDYEGCGKAGDQFHKDAIRKVNFYERLGGFGASFSYRDEKYVDDDGWVDYTRKATYGLNNFNYKTAMERLANIRLKNKAKGPKVV